MPRPTARSMPSPPLQTETAKATATARPRSRRRILQVWVEPSLQAPCLCSGGLGLGPRRNALQRCVPHSGIVFDRPKWAWQCKRAPCKGPRLVELARSATPKASCSVAKSTLLGIELLGTGMAILASVLCQIAWSSKPRIASHLASPRSAARACIRGRAASLPGGRSSCPLAQVPAQRLRRQPREGKEKRRERREGAKSSAAQAGGAPPASLLDLAAEAAKSTEGADAGQGRGP